jgi:hypothetical protein
MEIEPSFHPYQGRVLPLYEQSKMELRLRLERRFPLYERGVVADWTNKANLERREGNRTLS